MFFTISNSSELTASANPRNVEQVRNTLESVANLFEATASIPR